jgi:prevent-host-death family protein
METSEATSKSGQTAERVSAADARDRLAELMNRARFGGERFMITRNGEDVAWIIGAQESVAQATA